MINTSRLETSKFEKLNKYIPIILIIGLLIMRFPFHILGNYYHYPHITDADNVYWFVTYLLTSLFIIFERNNLKKYNISLSTIILIIIAPILPLLYSKTSVFASKNTIIAAIILAIVLIILHPPIHREKIKDAVKWLFISFILGMIYSIIVQIFIYNRFSLSSSTPISVTIRNVLMISIMQLANAAVSEEPLFRGFLWGYLKDKKWQEKWIWLFQAALFCLGHIYYLPENPMYFLGAFIGGLVLGLFVWKSKNISTSMIVHTLTDAMYRP